ncbi:oxidoreductase [Diaporthe helianthi]|uniref:Oxidoreductase n=1 Tax=Diaporthe helianthi TaxID=158607 RepID=A0A2P5IET2_DIAHE|nr:oxidoreductase [Diaporthe helianthi]
MAVGLRNVVVIGGSYVGINAAKELANVLPATHRVLLIDPHSHFNHLFAFPRFAILPDYEHKAFIPYSGLFTASPNKDLHAFVQAKVISLKSKELTLDREWQGSRQLSFDYLVAATGTRLASPGSMPSDDKASAVEYLKRYNQGIKNSKSVILIGGGAVGVQMACDLKEIYPDKDVTLVHSRQHIMPVYHEKLSDMIKARFAELGVKFIGGSRVNIPQDGYPLGGGGGGTGEPPITVSLQDGRTLTADFVVQATGQIPNTQFLMDLPASLSSSSSSGDSSLVNPENGFIRVRPTLQFQDHAYPHLYALGDVADSGAHKAARPGMAQAQVVAKNIQAMVEGRRPSEEIVVGPAGIHLTLGLTKNTIFRNPDLKAGETEPFINLKDDGSADMGIDAVWERRGVKVTDPRDYHL